MGPSTTVLLFHKGKLTAKMGVADSILKFIRIVHGKEVATEAYTHGRKKDEKMKAIEEMSIQELMELHTKVGDRIRYLVQMEAQAKMTRFYFGDVVTFEATDGRKIRGTLNDSIRSLSQ
jgi:hypothetical protein